MSLQVGAGETRSDFTGAKVRLPSWGRSRPCLFPNPQPPPLPACPSTPRQHLVAKTDPPLRGGLPGSPGGRKTPTPHGLAHSSLQRHRLRRGSFPVHSWQARPAHPATSYMWAPFAGAAAGGGHCAGVAVGTGFKRFHLRMRRSTPQSDERERRAWGCAH